MGPEQFAGEDKLGMYPSLLNLGSDKRREPDTECRKMLIESLALLTRSRPCRDIMRLKKVVVVYPPPTLLSFPCLKLDIISQYPVVRNMDKEEQNEEIHDLVYTLVNALLREEAPEDPPPHQQLLLEGSQQPSENEGKEKPN